MSQSTPSLPFHEATLSRILEPLCEATGALLREIRIRENEYLTLDFDAKHNKFVAKVRCLMPYSEEHEGVRTLFLLNGKKLMSCGDYSSPSREAAMSWAERLPERKAAGYGEWTLAATDFTVLVIASVWPKEKIIFLSEVAELQYEVLLTQFSTHTKTLKILSEFKLAGTLPEMPRDFIEHETFPLLPYQRVPIAAFLCREMSALFMEQGTGKTAVTINRICLEAKMKMQGKFLGLPKGMYRALIVCPRQLRRNWESEFAKFATVPGKVCVLRGGERSRVTSLVESIRPEPGCCWSATIVSYDSVEGILRAMKAVPWDLVVLDEAHFVKNTRTARFKAVQAVRDGNCRQRMILTGTPITNSPMDLYALFEFLGKGQSGFSTYENFRSFYGVYKNIGDGQTHVQKLVGLRNVPLLQERLARLSFAITKKDANLQLPDKTYDIYEVQMTPKQAQFYRKVANELMILLEDAIGSPKMTVEHILTQLLRLAQITSGHVKWDADEERNIPARVEQIDEKNPKVEAVYDLLTSEDRDPNGKTIVWATFIEDIRILEKTLKERGIDCVSFHGGTSDKDREIAVWRFNNDPSCKVFIGNPATAGTGLNLLGYEPTAEEQQDTYCDHEIFFSANWSAVQRSQAEDRAYRKGTKRSVRITDLVVPGSIDEEIRERVTGKLQMALAIQDIRDIMQRMVNLRDD